VRHAKLGDRTPARQERRSARMRYHLARSISDEELRCAQSATTTPAACEALQKLELDGVALTITRTLWFAAGAPLPSGRRRSTACC